MAKLVKLTSKDGVNNPTNSFKCQSDEDIYIEPMSTVSLLNAHISSGLLSEYNIEGSEIKGPDTGLCVSSLYLTADKSDRERRIVIPNGNYNSTTMAQQLEASSNKSLLFQSSASPLSNVSDVYEIPPEADFGLQMNVGIEGNKFDILFNSAKQKATNFVFSNKNNSINIDAATGNISYAIPAGTVTTDLDPTQENPAARTVTTIKNASTAGFNVNDPVQLVNTVAGNTTTSKITNIAQSATNLASTEEAITVEGANLVKVNTAFRGTMPNKFQIGSELTLDDGTSVDNANLSANIAYGNIQQINTRYAVADITAGKSYNVQISEVPIFNGFKPYTVEVQNLTYDEALATMTVDIDVPFGTANIGIDAGRFISLWTQVGPNPNSPVCVGEIDAVVDEGGNTRFLMKDVQHVTGKNILPALCKFVVSIDVFNTNDNGGRDIALVPPKEDTGSFDETLLMLYQDNNCLFQNTGREILQGSNITSNTIIFQEKSLICLDTTNNTLLDDIDAYIYFINQFGTIDISDYQFLNTCIIDKFVAVNYQDTAGTPINVASIGLVQGDPLVIDTINKTYTINISVDNYDPFDFKMDGVNDFAVIPIQYTSNALNNYNRAINIFITLINVNVYPYLVKRDPNIQDASKVIILTLNNLNPPDLQAIAVVPTRLWFGVNIYFTTTITLSNTFVPFNYNLMLKGFLDKGQRNSYAIEDTRLSKSCGRAVFKVVTAGVCKFGIIPETNSFISTSANTNFVSVGIINRGGGLVYTVFKGDIEQPLKTDITALDGDRVCFQWGVTPSIYDNEYNDTVSGATNPAALDPNVSISAVVADVNDEDRGKMLFSVTRDTRVDYFYLGSKFDTTVGAPDKSLCNTVPWTPRNAPYLPPIYWDNLGDYHLFVLPNAATIRVIELTQNPNIVNLNGVVKQISGENVLYDDTLHSQDHPELATIPHKLDAYSNFWYWVWNDLYFQKQLGYKTSSQYINAASGSYMATIDYLTAYLPESLVVFLDNIPSSSYDLEKIKGSRRNIIGIAGSAQGKIGEINIEPNNLYKIALNNKQPINLRKFIVSFETFFGEQIELLNARAVVNLLFEPPK